MRDLSVILPARQEQFLQRTIEDIFEHAEGDTEVIAILDGAWADPPISDHPRVTIIHNTEPVGQRAATNQGARLSQAKYIMKADAHCAFDQGFDVKLMEAHEHDWTVVPKMYNLHGFDWECQECKNRYYQADKPDMCCGKNEFEKIVVWKPRLARMTYSWRFDKTMQFRYWKAHRKRKSTRRGDYMETMSFIGACMFMERERYWELDGCDESHGSWGQFGTEWACKSWLSGGKLLTCKKTWFAHMFRTKNKKFSFPYKISANDQERARQYSRDLWLNDKWPKAKYKLEWLVEKFRPVPDWHKE
jgi:glycosyltransferase involved in cell wall biosynthesis